MNGAALIRCKRQPLARVVRIIRIVQRNRSVVGPAALRPGRDGDLDPLICHAVQIDLHAFALFRKPVILRAALGKQITVPVRVPLHFGCFRRRFPKAPAHRSALVLDYIEISFGGAAVHSTALDADIVQRIRLHAERSILHVIDRCICSHIDFIRKQLLLRII